MSTQICKLDRYCRGWRGRPYVKRTTNRKLRRLADRQLRSGEEPTPMRVRDVTHGWAS